MRYRIGLGAGIFLGIILIVAGLGKLLSEAESFKSIFNPFPDFLAPFFSQAVYSWLPYLEVVIGVALIAGVLSRLMAVFSLVLVAGFITNNSWLVSRGLGYEPCECFGVLERIVHVELSAVGALYLDSAMLVLALAVLFWHRGRFLNMRPWFLKKAKGARELSG